MTDTTKFSRRNHWQTFGFGGTVDWAVDLQMFRDDDSLDSQIEQDSGVLPSCPGTYDTMDGIKKDLGKIPKWCVNQYILQAFLKILRHSMDRYEWMTESEADDHSHGNYDPWFRHYKRVVVNAVPARVDEFMQKEGNNYFTCQVTEHIDSCKHCKEKGKDDQKRCKYCEDYDCLYTQSKSCGKYMCPMHEQRVKTMPQPCPPDYSQRGSQPDQKGSWPNSVDWSLKTDKEEEFWTAIEASVGVERGDYTWADKHDKDGAVRYGVRHEEEKHLFWNRNYPKASGFGESSVVDPSQFIDKAAKNITDMTTGIERLLNDIRGGKQVPNLGDIVDALEIPVLAVETAV